MRKVQAGGRKPLFLAAFVACIAGLPAHAAQPSLAVLQDVANDRSDVGRPGLRLGFTMKGRDWVPICETDSAGKSACLVNATAVSLWHLRSGGKDAGTITTQGWFDPDLIAAAGLLRVTTRTSLFAGPRTRTFAGWLDKPVHHPLVATADALGAATPRWTRTSASADDARAMLTILARVHPLVPDCSSGEPVQGKGRVPAPGDVRVTEIWQSASGERLIAATLEPDRVKACDYTGDLLSDVWAVSDGRSVRAIPELAAAETTHALVDGGDFAGDGKEELLFFTSGYNEDGFLLLYDHFTRAARFSWSYQ